MLETIATIILLIAFIGAVSLVMLLLMYGPGAAAGFAAGVTASRAALTP